MSAKKNKRLPVWRLVLGPIAGILATGLFIYLSRFAFMAMKHFPLGRPAFVLLALAGGGFVGAAIAPQNFMGFVQGGLLAVAYGYFIAADSAEAGIFTHGIMMLILLLFPWAAYVFMHRRRQRRILSRMVPTLSFEDEDA